VGEVEARAHFSRLEPDLHLGAFILEHPREAKAARALGLEQLLPGLVALGREPAPELEPALPNVGIGALGKPRLERARRGQGVEDALGRGTELVAKGDCLFHWKSPFG
jgi:hypothetical protein